MTADATITIVQKTVVVTPFGADALVPYMEAAVQSAADAAATAAELTAVEVADFRALAASTATNPSVNLSWAIKGGIPTGQTLSWDGYSVALDGLARSFTPPALDAILLARIVGNSIADTRDDNGTTVTHWPTILGAAMGLTIVNDAAYSSDWVQLLRAGLTPIMLTISGGVLPAAGTSASITAINGVAPSASPSDGVSFLSVGDSTVLSGLTMTGWIGDRHVTVSVPNGGSAAYSVVQDAGGAAVTLDEPVLFIPDHALSNGKGVLINATGQNYFYASIQQTYQGHTGYFNSGAFVADAAFRASARGWPVLEWPVLPQADWATTGAGNPYDAMTAFNALRETFAPQCKMRDAAGRTMLQRLQSAAIYGNADDAADIAAGLTPRSLRQKNSDGSYDALHPSVLVNAGQTFSGQQVIADFVLEAIVVAIATYPPPAITQSTTFTLAATGSTSTDTAVAVTELGDLAKSIPEGMLTSGQWRNVGTIQRLRLTGTGSISFDVDNGAGTIRTGVAPFTRTTANDSKIEWPWFGSDAARVRPTITGFSAAEML